MQTYRLVMVRVADFRKNDRTHYLEYMKDLQREHLALREVILLISKSGNQLLWLFGVRQLQGKRETRIVYDSRKWRLNGSATWHPLMIGSYAAEMGIKLVGFPRIEELFTDLRG